ncbi:MAG TPA: NADH oxidoreductase (quinone) subunit F [Firmicutes bacterium]|nr:NADH oxidoreductase (quinone) subunit F [Bacillota bacterium]
MSEIPRKDRTILSYGHLQKSASIKVALKNGAYRGLEKALRLPPDELIETVTKSGLRGRGGAGYPTGVKWSFMPKNPTKERPNFLIANADEGEPGTFKDREIIRKVPHKLIEGICIAAYAIRANRCYIYLRGEFQDEYDILSNALNEAREAGYIGNNILNSGFSCEIIVHRGAGAYICGEETALIDSLEGKRGHPRMRPPFPAQSGVFGMPTTVNNVETLAAVPWIIENGSDAYRKWGTEKSPGTKIFSISGHVNKPGCYECSLGTPLRELIEIAGGMRNGNNFKACFPGGSSCPLLSSEHIDIPFDYESLALTGSMLGSGGLIVMDETADLIKIMARVAKFYAHESCGKCTPCHQGTWWMAKIFDRIIGCGAENDDPQNLLEIAKNIFGNCFCPLGDAAAGPVISLVERFPQEFNRYMKSEVAVSADS